MGGSGNDLVTGVLAGADSTLQVFDSLTGGLGTDTLSITLAGGDTMDATSSAVLDGFEVLTVRPTAGGTIDFTSIAPNLNTLNINGAIGTFDTAETPTTISTVSISNIANDGVTLDFVYSAGLITAANALTLNVTNNRAATATSAAGDFAALTFSGAAANDSWDVVNVVATGANRFSAFVVEDGAAATQLRTVNISGDGTFRTALDFRTNAGTLNASTNTGGVNIHFDGLVAEDNVIATGGSGNDRFQFNEDEFNQLDIVDGGLGTNTLAIGTTDIDNTTVDLNAAIAAARNIQVLELTDVGGAVAVDAARVSQNSFVFAGAGDAFTLTNMGASDTATISVNAGAVTLGRAGLAVRSTTLTIANTTGAASDAEDLDITDFTNTVNIVSNSTLAVANTLTNEVQVTAGTEINVTGNAGLTATGGFSGAVTVNGLNAGGVLTITGSADDDLIIGGASGDTLVGGDGDDVITGNGGNDAIRGGLGADSINGGAGRNTYTIDADVGAGDSDSNIADAAVGELLDAAYLETIDATWDTFTVTTSDRIVVTDTAGALANSLVNRRLVAQEEGAAIAAGGTVYWNDGDSTYVLVDQDASGTIDVTDTFFVVEGVHTFALTLTGANEATLSILS